MTFFSFLHFFLLLFPLCQHFILKHTYVQNKLGPLTDKRNEEFNTLVELDAEYYKMIHT